MTFLGGAWYYIKDLTIIYIEQGVNLKKIMHTKKPRIWQPYIIYLSGDRHGQLFIPHVYKENCYRVSCTLKIYMLKRSGIRREDGYEVGNV